MNTPSWITENEIKPELQTPQQTGIPILMPEEVIITGGTVKVTKKLHYDIAPMNLN